MLIRSETLDDLLNEVFKALLIEPFNIVSSRSGGLGASSEIIGATLHLENPLARLSNEEVKGTLFSAVGELLWYLSKKNDLDFIQYYISAYKHESDDGKTIFGGYGPRMFNSKGSIDQVKNVIDLLKVKPTSRRAVIQIFDSADLIGIHSDIPCTCSLQFFVRNEKLYMYTSMRSNDVYRGLPHDIFAFTLLQEIIARSLNLSIGKYYHAVGSLHLYKCNEVEVQDYLKSGYQPTNIFMPSMPVGDPWADIQKLLLVEEDIRLNKMIYDLSNTFSNNYWADLGYILQAYSIIKKKQLNAHDINTINNIKSLISYKQYNSYIDQKINNKTLSI